MFDYKRTIYVCRQTLLVAAELAAYKLYMPFACDWQTGVIDFAMRQLQFSSVQFSSVQWRPSPS